MNDDAALIAAALAGQSAAFGELVRRYQDRLYNTLVHVTGSAEDARDVAQEAFVQAYTKLETFHGSSAFYTWLYRIAFNLAISHKRRAKPCLSMDQAREASGYEAPDRGGGPEMRLEQQERVDSVRRALSQLSEEHRSILVLRELEGYDYDAIGLMLDLPIGTVRSRLFRARMQLREQLKEVLQEEG